jgi:hypothetical protein
LAVLKAEIFSVHNLTFSPRRRQKFKTRLSKRPCKTRWLAHAQRQQTRQAHSGLQQQNTAHAAAAFSSAPAVARMAVHSTSSALSAFNMQTSIYHLGYYNAKSQLHTNLQLTESKVKYKS